jgi:hypothetical protein
MRRYGAGITGLVGGSVKPATFQFGHNGTSTTGTAITVDRAAWRGASRADRRGMLIHELTHVATRNQGLGGDNPNIPWAANGVEIGADAVRLALNGKVGINPDSLPGARRIAKTAGWLDGGNGVGTHTPGPAPGRGPGHLRNTGANGNSKAGQGVYAALAAGQAQQNAAQAASLQDAYTQALMQIKQQRGTVRAAAVTGRADVRAQAVTDMGAQEGAALQSGIVGSSVDAGARSGVLAARAQGLVDVTAQRNDALAQLQLQKFGAQTTLNSGMSELAASQAAQLAELQAQRYRDGLVSGDSEYKKLYQDALARLRAARGNGGSRTPAPSGSDVILPGYPSPDEVYTGYGRNRKV